MIDASRSARRWAAAALVGATALWGSSFLFGKVALRELSAGHTVLWRFVLAALVFLPFAFRVPRPASIREAGRFALAALLGIVMISLLQVEGLARTTATKAALMIGTLPPMAAVAAVVVLRERLSARVVVSLVLSCVGLAFVIGAPDGGGGSAVGDLLVVASVAVSVVFILVLRSLTVRYGALATSVWLVLFGAAWLVLLVPLRDGPPPVPTRPATWAALVGLAVLCTGVSQPLWNAGLRTLGAARASLFVNLEPTFGVLLGVLVLGEPVSTGLLVGAPLVLAAAVLAALDGHADPDTFGSDDLIAEAASAEGGTVAEPLPDTEDDAHPIG
ncbi:MAG: DMT family transporter [Bacteroidetes bacterium]|nr:DMT family transporter [Bacteroidota bacterium]